MKRPHRPLGLSLAIITSVMLFSILPLVQIGIILMLRQQFRAVEFLESGGAIGGDLMGIADSRLLLQVGLGVLFFLLSIAAWRGRPSAVRGLMVAAVLLMTALTIGLDLSTIFQQQDLSQGIDSSAALGDTLLWARIITSALVALYVVWYINRGPARAFYRGHYLPDPARSDQ